MSVSLSNSFIMLHNYVNIINSFITIEIKQNFHKLINLAQIECINNLDICRNVLKNKDCIKFHQKQCFYRHYLLPKDVCIYGLNCERNNFEKCKFYHCSNFNNINNFNNVNANLNNHLHNIKNLSNINHNNITKYNQNNINNNDLHFDVNCNEYFSNNNINIQDSNDNNRNSINNTNIIPLHTTNTDNNVNHPIIKNNNVNNVNINDNSSILVERHSLASDSSDDSDMINIDHNNNDTLQLTSNNINKNEKINVNKNRIKLQQTPYKNGTSHTNATTINNLNSNANKINTNDYNRPQLFYKPRNMNIINYD